MPLVIYAQIFLYVHVFQHAFSSTIHYHVLHDLLFLAVIAYEFFVIPWCFCLCTTTPFHVHVLGSCLWSPYSDLSSFCHDTTFRFFFLISRLVCFFSPFVLGLLVSSLFFVHLAIRLVRSSKAPQTPFVYYLHGSRMSLLSCSVCVVLKDEDRKYAPPPLPPLNSSYHYTYTINVVKVCVSLFRWSNRGMLFRSHTWRSGKNGDLSWCKTWLDYNLQEVQLLLRFSFANISDIFVNIIHPPILR